MLFIFLWIVAVKAQETCIFSDNLNDYYYDLTPLNKDNYLRVNRSATLIFNLCGPLNVRLKRLLQSGVEEPTLLPKYDLYNVILFKNQSFLPIIPYTKNLQTNLQLVRSEKPLQGLILDYDDGNVLFYLNCDRFQNLAMTNFYTNRKQYVISVSTSAACPVIVESKLWTFFRDLQVPFSVLLIVFGAFELFLGFRLLRVTFFLVGYMMGLSILTILLGVLVISSTSTIGTVVSLYVITTFVSILLGYFCVTQPVFGFFCIGAGLGVVLGLLMQNLFLVYLSADFTLLLITVIILIIVFGVFTRKYPEPISITSCSLMGAYSLVRPISWNTGDFPNELTISKLSHYDIVGGIPANYYFYLLVIIILTVVGITIQYALYYRQQQVEEFFEPSNWGSAQELSSQKDIRNRSNRSMLYTELMEVPRSQRKISIFGSNRSLGIRKTTTRKNTLNTFLKPLLYNDSHIQETERA